MVAAAGLTVVPTPIQFLQTTVYVLILFERAHTYRVIPTTPMPHIGAERGFRLLEEACHEGERHTDPLIKLGYKIYPGI